jgi:hypothetical protein
LILALLLHLLEEIRTGFPTGDLPLPVLVGINVVIYAFYFATLALALRNDKRRS